MKVIGINGSPRKGWNTETLVEKALEGAASIGAETELIQLYEEPIKGCLECYACKRTGNKTEGVCAIRDNLPPLLEKAYSADVIIIGSPNFFGYPSGMVRSFLERFLYPLASYQIEDGKPVRILGQRIIPAGIIFTMNSNEHFYGAMNYEATLGATRQNLEYVLGYAEQYNSFDTLQFADYSKMDANMFNPAEKQHRHDTQFPIDERNCFEMGIRLVKKVFE
ncbi:flavodoxin family protein [Muribaculum intestinale]|uniref:flavodoxin family protein n=1 Tax=Muribaculum intestinale TaxID=1796646 RepID=UPI00261681AB|nr:flavodoxin family protein [Muribaculum intestinale]